MQVFTTPSKIIITCHKWLAISLQKEVIALGFMPDRVFQTGVELTGTVQDCIKLKFKMRQSSNVFYKVIYL